MQHKDVHVLSSKEASLLVSKRSLLPKKFYLSVKGCVTALSEKIRVKNEDSFLVELDHCIHIIVKDYHLEWHNQLVPLETIVFYQLRLTTIEKGVQRPQPILVVWKQSSMLKISDKDDSIVCTPIKEWLSWIHPSDLIQDDGSSSSANKHEHSDDIVQCFTGKVESVDSDEVCGLSGEMRLVPRLSTSISDSFYLHFGSSVQVYNAHKVLDIVGRETLLCCIRSLVKSDVSPVIKQNLKIAKESLKKVSSLCSLEDLKSTITEFGLNFKEVQALLHARNVLENLKSGNTLKNLLHYFVKSCCSNNIKDKSVSVSPLDMFLDHEQFCPFIATKSSECRIKATMNVVQLQEYNVNDTLGMDSSDSYWKFKNREWIDEEILLGCILIDKEGQTIFVDQSGKIPVVLINKWKPNEKNSSSSLMESHPDDQNVLISTDELNIIHHCSFSCEKVVKAGEKIICPILDPNIIGKLLFVKKFVLIIENSSDMKESCDGNESVLKYLMFSLQDCSVLETHKNCADHIYKELISYGEDIGKHQNFILKNDYHIACLIYVSGKNLRFKSEKYKKCFHLIGRMIDPSLFKLHGPSVKNLNVSAPTDFIHGELKKVAEDEGKILKRQSKRSYEACDVGFKKKKCEDMKSHHVIQAKSGTSENLLSKTVPVMLICSGENLSIYPCIFPGNFYLLTTDKKNNVHAFKPMFSCERLGTVTNMHSARTVIEVPAPVAVKQAFGRQMGDIKEHIDEEDGQKFLSVAHVLSRECKKSLVSFTAVILVRNTKISYFSTSDDKSKKCPNAFNFRDLHLVLCDTDAYMNSHCDSAISLYFEQSYILLYELGLIPGSVLEVFCVERKVSRANKVYCRFIALSSIHVKSYVPLSVCQNPSLKTFMNIPVDYIGSIWNRKPVAVVRDHVWHILCHICVVFSLRLQLLCKKCRGVFVRSACQRRGCDNVTSFDVDTYSVVLVEDGTGQAKIVIRRPDLVCRLLTLNEIQWDAVISLLQNVGEITISKQMDPAFTSPLEMFLTNLISSSVLTRPLKMLVKVFKHSHGKDTVDKMNEKEFPLRPLHTGSGKLQHKFLCLPLMDLNCLDMEEVDP